MHLLIKCFASFRYHCLPPLTFGGSAVLSNFRVCSLSFVTCLNLRTRLVTNRVLGLRTTYSAAILAQQTLADCRLRNGNRYHNMEFPLRLPVVLSLPARIKRRECEFETLLPSIVKVQNPLRFSYRHTGKVKLCVLVSEIYSENDIILHKIL